MSAAGPRPEDLWLTRSGEHAAGADAFAGHATTACGLAGLLDRLDRRGRPARVPGRAVRWGFRWDREDRATRRWWPQGVTSSADAAALGTGDGEDDDPTAGRRLLVTSWYSRGDDGANHGSRVTVVDLDTLAYGHVLLVAPAPGAVTGMRPLRVHAGGLAWCGPWLHVAATRRGLAVCRMADVVEVEPGPQTLGHRFVLPVRFCYDAGTAEGVPPMRYSFCSVEHGGTAAPHLVVGEYAPRDARDAPRRLARFAFDPATGLLRADADDCARPAYLGEGVGQMQGAVVAEGRWLLTSSRGAKHRGSLYAGGPGRFHEHRRALPVGPEDAAYWPSTGSLWSLTEYPGRRFVFCLPGPVSP